MFVRGPPVAPAFEIPPCCICRILGLIQSASRDRTRSVSASAQHPRIYTQLTHPRTHTVLYKAQPIPISKLATLARPLRNAGALSTRLSSTRSLVSLSSGPRRISVQSQTSASSTRRIAQLVGSRWRALLASSLSDTSRSPPASSHRLLSPACLLFPRTVPRKSASMICLFSAEALAVSPVL